MNEKEIKQILNLNKKFYQSVAKDFSATRKKPWEGWDRAVKIMKKELRKVEGEDKIIKILDLGCGNGRFFEFINSRITNINYVGVDINNDLLREAEEKYTRKNGVVKFIKKDILNNIESLKGGYDVVVVFGLTHHIPNKIFRKKWFSHLPKILNKNGLLILTFWEFEKKPGDYLVGWDNKKNIARYCYQYPEADIKNLIKNYEKSGLKILDDYFADNKNRYLIFGKI